MHDDGVPTCRWLDTNVPSVWHKKCSHAKQTTWKSGKSGCFIVEVYGKNTGPQHVDGKTVISFSASPAGTSNKPMFDQCVSTVQNEAIAFGFSQTGPLTLLTKPFEPCFGTTQHASPIILDIEQTRHPQHRTFASSNARANVGICWYPAQKENSIPTLAIIENYVAFKAFPTLTPSLATAAQHALRVSTSRVCLFWG